MSTQEGTTPGDFSRPIITIFGSGRTMQGDTLYDDAYHLGISLARAGFRVCNGGFGGIMEASARGAKDGGSIATGVIPASFGKPANPYVDDVVIVPTLFDRLQRLIETGDAYIFLPGGTGTLLELAAVWEFLNKRLMDLRPMIVLGDFWEPVVSLMSHRLRDEGTPDSLACVFRASSTDAAVGHLLSLKL